ncbi:3'-5' exonuclease [Pseudogemmobacter sp. CC-YST710]|uniref:3'-5' exonuclease n=2 Tax=Pseudogemmobacter faecipullorum TaxID=2755041 RepID=A0ABS8CJL0_9RHOB|nr:3'-5' exonuclease [Pseudogemmobacter faecipullorum]
MPIRLPPMRQSRKILMPSAPPPFPQGPFRFFALDVETANNERGSICQIGVAAVTLEGQIRTWVSYVNPETDRWTCSFVHGITDRMVQDAPKFATALAPLRRMLEGKVVWQHSSFDRTAIFAACERYGLERPEWDWQDSVRLARSTWPELKGNGGHGLASLKKYLGLQFRHHDAGEDARAAAEIVLRAELQARS